MKLQPYTNQADAISSFNVMILQPYTNQADAIFPALMLGFLGVLVVVQFWFSWACKLFFNFS
jgi:hypothetical protein